MWCNFINKSGDDISICTEFTKGEWDNNPYTRIYIVEDLEKKYDICSMNKNEVLDLLGTSHCVVSEKHITYTLGQKKEDLLFSYYRIDLDGLDNVEKTTVYQD